MTTEKTQLGRNEPCPCGSGKKYKRCCGKDAAPKLGAPMDMSKRLEQLGGGSVPAGGATNPMSGFDPSQLDPAWVSEVQKQMARLPRGQLQRIQALMSKAMSGKDVSREAAEMEKMMPPAFLEMMRAGPMAQMLAQQGGAPATAGVDESGMSVDEARRLVEEAASKGEISMDDAQELLASAGNQEKSGKLSKLWKGLTGKK